MAKKIRRPLGHDLKGLTIAGTILLSWLGLLALLLTREFDALSPFVIIAAVLVQTFLYTGLFITAHDAMHRTLSPNFPRLNDAIGRLCVILFALFSFKKLRKSHWEHHRHPASADDPDFHDGQHPHPLRWYVHFMVEYVTVLQIVAMALVFNFLQFGFDITVANLVAFWVIPSLLSTVQLFYFGTYLPHRAAPEGYRDGHRARSNDFPLLVSFLTCYHFGYHWEHHERPDLAWWELPRFRASSPPLPPTEHHS